MVELGKYAFAVISAYGLTIAAIAALIFVTWAQARRSKRDLEAAEARRDSRKADGNGD